MIGLMRSYFGLYLGITNPESPDLPEMTGQIDAHLPICPKMLRFCKEFQKKQPKLPFFLPPDLT
jgi:hypothetical protein